MTRRLRDDEEFVPARPRRPSVGPASAGGRAPAPTRPATVARGKAVDLDECHYLTARVSPVLDEGEFWVARYDSPDDGYCMYHSLRTLLLSVPWSEESNAVAAKVLQSHTALRSWLLENCPTDALYMAAVGADLAPRPGLAKKLEAASAERDVGSAAWQERHEALLRQVLAQDRQGASWTLITLSMLMPELAFVVVERDGDVDAVAVAGSAALQEKRARLARTYGFALDEIPPEFALEQPGATSDHPATLVSFVQGKEIYYKGATDNLFSFAHADYARAVMQQRGIFPSAVLFLERNGMGAHHYQPLVLDGSTVGGRPVNIGALPPKARAKSLAIRPAGKGQGGGREDRYFLYRDTAPTRFLSALQFDVARVDPETHGFRIISGAQLGDIDGARPSWRFRSW